MSKFLRFMIGIGFLAAALVFLLAGGWRILGFGANDPMRPSLTYQQRHRKSALESELREDGVKLLFYIPEGMDARITLSWSVKNATYGAQELEKFRLKGEFASYKPEGAHFLDLRSDQEMPAYVGRYIIRY